jgi:hypothetical protein
VPGLRVWLAHFGSAAGLATEVRGAGGTLRLGSHELDLARAKGWNAGAANSLEVLRDGQRCAVRLNGMDAGAWDGCGAVGPDGTPWVAVELTMPTGEATSVGPWRRLVPAQ